MFIKHLSAPLTTAVLGLSLILVAVQVRAEPTSAPAPRIATLDWTIAETLMGLGIAPQAVAQIAAYHEWVGQPELPDRVIDLGLRTQPNIELLAELQPDVILISPMFSNIAPRLSRIAAVETLELYTPGSDTWEQMIQLTLDTATLAGNPRTGHKLVERTEAAMVSFRQQLPSETEPLLIVQFMDARHVRVFGENGLYHAVLDQLGLDNAWTGETNSWGFSLLGLEDLLGVKGQLVVVEPSPLGVEKGLADNGLWQALPDVRDDSVLSLPPVWSFGALPSALRFADALTSALVAKHDR